MTRRFRWLAAGVTVLLAVLVTAAPPAQARMYADGSKPQPSVAPGRLTIQFEDNVQVDNVRRSFGRVSLGISSLDQILDDFGVTDARPIFQNARRPAPGSQLHDLSGFYELEFPEDVDLSRIIDELHQNPNIRLAEPVPVSVVMATPNDPDWDIQWHLAPPGLDPHYYDAWDIETGSDDILIGVVDTGILYDHRDLEDQVWVNPGEDLDGDGAVFDPDDIDGIDSDSNGFIDDLIGWDFTLSLPGGAFPGEDGIGRDNDPKDFDGHGTHVGGIAAATTNNGEDVGGIAGGWYGGHRSFRGCRLMCIRAGGTNADGDGVYAANDLAAAVNYAVQMGASVVNASWGGGSFSTPLANAIDNAIANGVSFIHAAGNDNISSPGWHDLRDGVISVAATSSSDLKWTWNPSAGSNYGSWVDVSAPGQDIRSTVSNGYNPGQAVYTGTSMAAPNVAGLHALIKSMAPQMTGPEIDTLIMNTTDDIDPLNPSYAGMLGTGRINALTALSQLANAKFEADVLQGAIPLMVQFTDLSPNSPTSWDWEFGDGGMANGVQNPSHTYTEPGIYDVKLTIDDANGTGVEKLNRYIWVQADSMDVGEVGAFAGTQAVVPVSISNTSPMKRIVLPIKLTNVSPSLTVDSVSVDGLARSSFFDFAEKTAENPSTKQYVLDVRVSAPSESKVLSPGSGVVFNIFVRMPGSIAAGTEIAVDSASIGSFHPVVESIWGDYFPMEFSGGKITVICCQGRTGNVDQVGVFPTDVDSGDLGALVNFLFSPPGTVTLPCPTEADVNALGGPNPIDSSDLGALVNFLFAPPGTVSLPDCP